MYKCIHTCLHAYTPTYRQNKPHHIKTMLIYKINAHVYIRDRENNCCVHDFCCYLVILCCIPECVCARLAMKNKENMTKNKKKKRKKQDGMIDENNKDDIDKSMTTQY